jgi:hypothetical protein
MDQPESAHVEFAGAVVTARKGGRESGGRQQRSGEVSVGGLRVEESGGYGCGCGRVGIDMSRPVRVGSGTGQG